MTARVFQGNEHEFVRIAALSRPDWEGLRQLAQEGVDWGSVWEISARHQLGGVISWRLLAPELDSIVPETVRESSRSRLGVLTGMRAGWQAQVAPFIGALRATGIPMAIFRVPVSYTLYPGFAPENWPRELDHIDLSVDGREVNLLAKAEAALQPLGLRPGTCWPEGRGDPTFTLPGGLIANITLAYGPDARGDDTSVSPWDVQAEPAVFQGVEWRSVYDVDLPVMAPEVAICLRGWGIWVPIMEQVPSPAPCPVGELSHIANLIASRASFDWSATLSFCQDLVARHKRWNAVMEQWEKDTGGKRHPRMTTLQASPLAWIAWVWDLVDRVYQCFPKDFKQQVYSLLGGPPDPLFWGDDPGPETPVEQAPRTAIRWKSWPGDEEFVFEPRDPVTDIPIRGRTAERVADGIWEEVAALI